MQYALEGAIGVGGAGVSWLRDNLNLIESAAESEGLAASVPSTEGEGLERMCQGSDFGIRPWGLLG